MDRISTARPRIDLLLLLLIAISLLMTACAAPPTAAQPEAPAPEVTQTDPVLEPPATPTPEPEIGRLILVMDPPDQKIDSLLRELARENQMELEVRTEVQPQDIQPTWKVVVLLPAPQNLTALVESAPGVQFVVSSDSDLPVSNNLSILRSRAEHLAFAAGYIGAVITPDWRIAGLFPQDSALGDRLGEAFQNGVHYYCGLCRTLYAPFVRWPLIGMLPASSDDAAWQAAVAELEPSIVYGMYVDSRVGSVQFLEWLAAKNIVLFGGQTPPSDVLPRWAVTLRPQTTAALSEIMPAVIAGSGGQQVNAGLEMADINERLLSPGRQRMIEDMLEDLMGGFIEPFNVPLE